MIYINNIELEEISIYFLAEDDNHIKKMSKIFENEKLLSIAKNLKEMFFEKDVNILFKFIEDNFDRLYHDRIIQLKQDYFSNLVHNYNNGKVNPEITYLITTSNEEFNLEIQYQKNLRQALIIDERRRLKKMFQEIELLNVEEFKNNKQKYNFIPQLTWIKFAVAASIFGLVITTGVLYHNNGNQAKLTNLVKKDKNQLSNELALFNEQKLKSSTYSIVILTNNSFGFAQEQRNIIITIYEIEKRLNTLIATAKNIEDPILRKRFERQVDSLSNLINTYSFNNKTLTIYLNRKKNVSVVYIKDKYYAVIDKVPYYIIPNSDNIKLMNETNREILDQIERIVL